MPIYDYECRNCGAQVSDVFQKVTDPELTKCDECNTNSLYRVVTGGLHSFMAGSNTIGGVADRNTRINKNQINEMEAMKREANPTPDKPWYQKQGGKSMKDINKMNDKQKAKYIMEGD
jgi:putative FmdB family regulatory protein